MPSRRHANAHPPDASSLPREDSESSALATLVGGFKDIRTAEKNTAIKELTESGYLGIYDVTPDTIEELEITAGAKKAMKRQLKTAQEDKVPTGEKQIIGANEISAMDAYVADGIKNKEFSWGVPLPDNKPLIDTDTQSYTWNAPDTRKWNAPQVVDVVSAAKFQYGLLSGVSDPSTTLLHASHPALCLKGADGWRDVALRPVPTFEKSVAVFSGTYNKMFERTSKSMSVAGSGGSIIASFSAHVKNTFNSLTGSIEKNEEFSTVTKVSYYGCELNLANHLAIRPEVEQEFAEVCDDPEMNSIQKHAEIKGLFEKYGAFCVRRCKLGVQATGTSTLKSKFSFRAKDLASTLEAGCSLSLFSGADAAKSGFGGSSELQETAKEVSERLNVEVIGATIAPGPNFLSSIADSASDPRQWAVLDIKEIVPITDLFDPVLRKKVNCLDAQPLRCQVALKTSASSRHPSVTVGAADIERQLGKGYIVIGGGADITGGQGLTKSCPTYDAKNCTTGWTAASENDRKAVVTAYAICLKSNDPLIKLDAKVVMAMQRRTRRPSIELTQFQAQQQYPGYTLVSGGGMCENNGVGTLTSSSPTGTAAAIDGWALEAAYREGDEGGLVVHGVMLKNLHGFQYRVKCASMQENAVPPSPSPRLGGLLRIFGAGGAGLIAPMPSIENRPELSATQLVCGGGVKTFFKSFNESTPIIDRATGAPIGWAAKDSDFGAAIEAYTVYFDLVPSV